MTSPRIVAVSWGELEVDGFGRFKDVMVYPGGVRPWDWTLTGTRHAPGIQPADVEVLLAHGATVVVLSRGMEERLETDPATLEYLAARGIEVHTAESTAAVALYNRLAADTPVGALIHSTC